MLNPQEIKEHFQLVGGRLYKRLKGGTGRRVQTVRDGRLVTLHHGTWLYGPDVAWTLYYGTPPMFQVFTLDGDPHNLTQENVVAARLKRLRFRFRETPSGFKHALNKYVAFSSVVACRDDWLGHARAYYAADHATVRELEDALLKSRPLVPYARPVKTGKPPVRVAAVKPPPPQYRAGYRHYWQANQWVVVPEACHPADDLQVRCAAVLRGAVRFVFDAVAQRVVALDEAGAVV